MTTTDPAIADGFCVAGDDDMFITVNRHTGRIHAEIDFGETGPSPARARAVAQALTWSADLSEFFTARPATT